MSAAPSRALAVLVSGGLDSAILLGEALQNHDAVHPLYVRQGMQWETVERSWLERYLAALSSPALRPLQVLDLPVDDLLAGHWSVTGLNVPDAASPDEAVFLPARNILLLAKAMLWCHLRGVPAVALATLRSNPFPDATPAFFQAFQDVVNQGIGSAVEIRRPYAQLGKRAVMERGRGFPLEYSFSCIRPVGDRHCGVCNKCMERQVAFREANLTDPTIYQGGIERS
jgi:7-cyano-7-deazaguanine synthase